MSPEIPGFPARSPGLGAQDVLRGVFPVAGWRGNCTGQSGGNTEELNIKTAFWTSLDARGITMLDPVSNTRFLKAGLFHAILSRHHAQHLPSISVSLGRTLTGASLDSSRPHSNLPLLPGAALVITAANGSDLQDKRPHRKRERAGGFITFLPASCI